MVRPLVRPRVGLFILPTSFALPWVGRRLSRIGRFIGPWLDKTDDACNMGHARDSNGAGCIESVHKTGARHGHFS
jgi:hypothetical protein